MLFRIVYEIQTMLIGMEEDESDKAEPSNSKNNSNDKFITAKELYYKSLNSLIVDKTFTLALIIIISFVIISLMIYIMKVDKEVLRDIDGLWGSWIGAAIGYFFGSRPVESLMKENTKLANQRINNLEEELKKHRSIKDRIMDQLRKYDNILREYRSKLLQTESKHIDAINMLKDLRHRYGQHFDKDTLDKLNKEYGV